MKIKAVHVDNRKKRFTILTSKGELHLPFVKLPAVPSSRDPIAKIYVDDELGKEAVTYFLRSGREETVHVDVFLDFNRDPTFLKQIFLFKLTDRAQRELKESKISKNEICRRLGTSPSQLARLLDQTNQKKSIDKMLELLAVLGVVVEPEFMVA